jgi:hypothetical protein
MWALRLPFDNETLANPSYEVEADHYGDKYPNNCSPNESRAVIGLNLRALNE